MTKRHALAMLLGFLPLVLLAQPAITIEGDGLLIDAPFNVRISGLSGGVGVKLQAQLSDEAGRVWRSSGRYFADINGEMEVSRAYSVGGSYEGVDPDGLLWSMSPVLEADKSEYLKRSAFDRNVRTTPVLSDGGAFVVDLHLETDDGVETSATFSRRLAAAAIKSKTIHEGRVHGRLYIPEQQSRGAVLVLTGSGGGLDTLFGPLLASHGYLVLAQAYFAWEGVQPALHDIPLELFAAGIDWLSEAAQGMPVVLMGTSRGSEAVLLTAIHFPERVAGVIARVPSHVVNASARSGVEFVDPSWTVAGEALPYLNYDDGSDDLVAEYGADPSGFRAADGYLRAWNALASDSPFHIQVERLPGPLLIISGAADEVWPSAIAGDRLVRRLQAKSFPHGVKHLRLADAGHGIRLPGQPTSFTRSYHPLGVFLRMGGTPSANADAAKRAWRWTLEFLQQLSWR